MRFCEIISESSNLNEELKSNHAIDVDTGLRLNYVNQTSDSPYLGAVVEPNGTSYRIQIHIPNANWERVINGKNMWQNTALPDGYLNSNAKNRSTIVVRGFDDPRQAAWVSQEILYNNPTDFDDNIVAALYGQYIDGRNIRDIWGEYINNIPHFEGPPLTTSNKKEWQAAINNATEQQRQLQKDNRQNENIIKFFNEAIPKIKKVFMDITKSSKANGRKIFGDVVNQQTVSDAMDAVLSNPSYGPEYFYPPKSIKMKDPLSMDLSMFAQFY